MNQSDPDIIHTTDASLLPTSSDRRLALHEAICRCSQCRGDIQKHRLCSRCFNLDKTIDQLKRDS